MEERVSDTVGHGRGTWMEDQSAWARDRGTGLDQHKHRRKLLCFEYILFMD